MQFTLGQIISTASSFVGGRLDWTPSEISLYANMALEEVATSAHFRGKETLAATSNNTGENRIPMPADCERVLGLFLSYYTGSSLRTLTAQSILTQVDQTVLDSKASAAGAPEYWGEFGGIVQVWPTPASSYSLTMRYERRQSTLTNSASTPLIEDRYHQAWLYKTCEILADSRKDQQTAMYWGQKYTARMDETPNDNAWQKSPKEQLGLQLRR